MMRFADDHHMAFELPSQTTGLAAEFATLAERIAAEGVGRHTADLVRLGRLALDESASPGVVDALLDPTSAPVVRERAAVLLSLELGLRRPAHSLVGSGCV